MTNPATLFELREALERRQLSSRELTQHCVTTIDRLDGGLRAFRVVLATRALAQAAAADAALARGDRRPLLGVPVAVKDVVDVANELTTFGTSAVQRPAAADGAVVSRLIGAGAVVVGKTNTSEMQIWALTASQAHGVTRNPWNPERSPGGTSGGSAVAVAAGMVPGAHGVDGGGSIRLPAAWCGLVGFKPARPPGHAPSASNWFGLAVHGALGQTVPDAALLADALRADGDVRGLTQTIPDRALKIAVCSMPPTPQPVQEIERRAVHRAAGYLAELGHDVRELAVHGSLREASRSATAVLVRFLAAVRRQASTLDRPGELEPRTRSIIRAARAVTPERLHDTFDIEASEHRRLLSMGMDVILTPVSASTAPPADAWDGLGAIRTFARQARLIPFTPLWNLVGWPVVVLPIQLDDHGVPVGVQLIAAPHQERHLLAVSAQLDERRPPLGPHPRRAALPA